MNLGLVYNDSKQKDTALLYLKNAIGYLETIKDAESMDVAFANIGIVNYAGW